MEREWRRPLGRGRVGASVKGFPVCMATPCYGCDEAVPRGVATSGYLGVDACQEREGETAIDSHELVKHD